MLQERNKSFEAIKFVDISSKDYSPEENQGLEYETVWHLFSLPHLTKFFPFGINKFSEIDLLFLPL